MPSLTHALRPLVLGAALLAIGTGGPFTAVVAAQNCTCASCAACSYYEPGTPAPLGTYNRAWQCGQVRAGHKALVVHLCDWIGESNRLSPFVQRYLVAKLTSGCSCGCRLLIEPSGEMVLDESRRSSLVNYLTENDLGGYADVVAIGYGTRDRLLGEDSQRVLENFGYQRTRAQANQFNPFIGYGAPLIPGAGATVGGTTLPSIQGLFGR
ncbi:MAG: hypothetical protein AAF266_07115 [Planctomycetota bacterium]